MKIKIQGFMLILAAMFLIRNLPLMAQTSGTGGLTGKVTDPTGATVANAMVTATNVGTSQTRTTATAADGTYAFNLLPPGVYRVRFEATGFQAVEVPSVTVNVTETQSLDSRLEVGTQSQQVTVEAEADVVQTTSATLGTVIAARTVTDLPLSTRNYINLISLSAGAASTVQNATAVGRGTTTTAVNGSSISQNNYQMDGATITDTNAGNGFGGGEGGSTGFMVLPNPDAIQEFKIQTSIYDAGYGRGSGASVNVITKSGTNQFHGSLFEFFRNTALNANDWFFKQAGKHRFVLNQNQFGGTVGGPVKKDKIFFFGSYQETKQINGSSTGASSPTLPAIPAGDRGSATWRDSLYALYCRKAGVTVGVVIQDPSSVACPNSYPAGKTASTQIAVPINPVAINILQLKLPDGSYYIPSGPGGLTTYSDPATFAEYQGMANVDYLLSPKNTVAAKWFYSEDPSSVHFLSSIALPGFQGSRNNFPGTIAQLALTSTLSNTLVNNVHVSYQRYGVFHDSHPAAFTNTQVGMSVLNPQYPDLTAMSIGGAFQIGNNYFGFANMVNNQTQWADQLSWSHGKHTIRAGYEVGYYIRRYLFGLGANIGNVTISSFPDFLIGLPGCTPGVACSPTSPGGTNGTSVSDLASNASTIKTGSTLDSNGNPTVTNPSDNIANTPVWDQSVFVQDDFKVTDRLTINAGLRWDYFPFYSEKQGKLTNEWLSLERTVPFPLAPAPCLSGSNQLPTVFPTPCPGGTYVGYVIPANYNVAALGPVPQGVYQNVYKSAPRDKAPKDNFSPRLGFAWQPFHNGRFVVRGGGGYFFHRLAADDFYIPEARQGPYAAGKQASGSSYYYASLAAPFSQTIGWQPRWYTAAGATSNLVFQATNETFQTPLAYEYNLSIQYEFLPRWLLEVGYVGSHAIHQFTGGAQGGTPYNPALMASATNPLNCGYNGGDPTNPANCITQSTTSNINLRVPYLGVATSVGDNGTGEGAKYDSLQTTVRKQLSHGFSLQASYTYLKALVTMYQGTNDTFPVAHVYGLNPQYRPQRLTLVYSWDLPLGHPSGLASKLVVGWTVSGVATFQDGVPITITDSRGGTIFGSPVTTLSNAQFSTTGNNGDVQTSGKVVDRINNYFDPTAFVAPPAPTAAMTNGCSGTNCGTLYGNSGFGITRGPNQNNWDMTLAKITKVGGLREVATLQFRVELFNAFNHTQFSNPAAGFSSLATFGHITSTSVNSRLMQLALKYVF